ncbi:hypothetical protein NLU13_1686 [Sarocladium strictum]|uniref:Uncharacterized protein n=1 Tax=Sarocladium strictum TaxID=5046 RepID=A0AA39GT06_SARSR|nr:hypothetical protein NLU13_1686 [Sarocladium strictum]
MAAPFHHPFQESQFNLFVWYPKYLDCQRFFLERAQYSVPVQTVAAFINIQLPFQKGETPASPASGSTASSSPANEYDHVHVSGSSHSSSRAAGKAPARHPSPPTTSLIPFIRRLVATGFDNPGTMHGFFGDEWREGVGEMHEMERRNFLFAAKSDTWLKVKAHYDMPDGQVVPFLRPLARVMEKEIQSAERDWSNWLAMQDWMLGPRSLTDDSDGPRVKMEED